MSRFLDREGFGGGQVPIAGSTPTPTPTPTPSPTPTRTRALIASNGTYLGRNGTGLSSGSATTETTAWPWRNDLGVIVTEYLAFYENTYMSASNPAVETAGPDPLIVSASHQASDGTLTLAETAPVTIAPGGLASLRVRPARGILPGAVGVTRTRVEGARWPRGAPGTKPAGYGVEANAEAAKLTSGTIAASAAEGYIPSAIVATEWIGTLNPLALAAVGDSWINAAGDGLQDDLYNSGWVGRAAARTWPLISLGVTGATAFSNLPSAMAKRNRLLAELGVTDVLGGYGTNDIAAGRTAAQIIADITAIAQAWKEMGLRVWWTTISPRSPALATGLAYREPSNQTPAAAFSGAGSVMGQVNAWLRSETAPIDVCIDVSDVVSTARDSGIWRGAQDSTAANPSPRIGKVYRGLMCSATSTAADLYATNYSGPDFADGFKYSRSRVTSGALSGTVFDNRADGGPYNDGRVVAGRFPVAGLPSAPAAGDTFDAYERAAEITSDGIHLNMTGETTGGHGLARDWLRERVEQLFPGITAVKPATYTFETETIGQPPSQILAPNEPLRIFDRDGVKVLRGTGGFSFAQLTQSGRQISILATGYWSANPTYQAPFAFRLPGALVRIAQEAGQAVCNVTGPDDAYLGGYAQLGIAAGDLASLEVVADGSTVSLFAWKAGQPRPSVPAMTIAQPGADGVSGLLWSGAADFSVTEIQVAPVA